MTSRTHASTRQTKPRRLNRAEKREANRERILRAARTVFGKRGFHAATIEEIADEAGLSNGAIYYNFANKGDLFFELLDERQNERIRHMRRTLTRSSAPDASDRALADAYLPGARRFQPRDRAQQGGLPATGRAEQGEELAVGDVQVERVHGAHPAREVLRQPAQRHPGHQLLIPPWKRNP